MKGALSRQSIILIKYKMAESDDLKSKYSAGEMIKKRVGLSQLSHFSAGGEKKGAR